MEKIVERILEVLLRIEERIVNNNASEHQKSVSISEVIKDAVTLHIGDDGEYDGILIKAIDREFILSLNDYVPQSVTRVVLRDVDKEKEWRLMKFEEALLIILYLPEINTLLKRFGTPIDANCQGNCFWIEPKNDKYRYMRLGYMDQVFSTTSADSKYFLRCVKDVQSSNGIKNERSGTCC